MTWTMQPPTTVRPRAKNPDLAATIRSEAADAFDPALDPSERAGARANLAHLCALALTTERLGPETGTTMLHAETRAWYSTHRRWMDSLTRCNDHELRQIAAARR